MSATPNWRHASTSGRSNGSPALVAPRMSGGRPPERCATLTNCRNALGAAATYVTRSSSKILSQSAGLKSDRKSTRLNSSHVKISYAVFCLIKKKEQKAIEHIHFYLNHNCTIL